MNTNDEKCLGENTYKRNNASQRKRRIVVNETVAAAPVVTAEDENPKMINFSDGSYDWTPYPKLPIAPGLPDIIPMDYKFSGYPTRSTCADVMKYCKEDESNSSISNGEDANISFDLSKFYKK